MTGLPASHVPVPESGSGGTPGDARVEWTLAASGIALALRALRRSAIAHGDGSADAHAA